MVAGSGLVVLTQGTYFACNLVYAGTLARGQRYVYESFQRDIHTMHDFIVDSQSGEKLELTRVDRRQMGAYLCIAKNEVPPAVSKRVYLRVNCE